MRSVADRLARPLWEKPPGFASSLALVEGGAAARFYGNSLRAQLDPLNDAFAELRRQAAAAEEFERTWGRDALWYLLAHLEWHHARKLAGLPREQVEAALLASVEAAVRDEEFAAAVRNDLKAATMLNASQLRHLDHALEHAQAGEFVDASPPLTNGLEARSGRRRGTAT